MLRLANLTNIESLGRKQCLQSWCLVGPVTSEATLANFLSRHGHLPVVLDNLSTGHDWAVKFGPLVQGDVEDSELVRKTVRKYGVQDVIHFAAKAYVAESVSDPGKYFRENVVKTVRLLDMLIEEGVPRMIFSSSCAVYGTPACRPTTESAAKMPVNPLRRKQTFHRTNDGVVWCSTWLERTWSRWSISVTAENRFA